MEFFNKPKIPVRPIQKPKGEGCKIKIKNSASGRTISFEGNCTKEQLQMAKSNLGEFDEDDTK